MKVSDAFPSNYLKATDLNDHTPTLAIDHVAVETLGDDRKPVAYFTDTKKGLVLNKTNATAIAAEHGDDMDAWKGKKIELFAMPVTFQGQTRDAIRVRPIKVEPPQDVASELNDPLDI